MKKIVFAILLIFFLSGCGEKQNPIAMVNVSIQVFNPEDELLLEKEISVPKNSTALSILEKNINFQVSDSKITSVEGIVPEDFDFIVLYINDSQIPNLNKSILIDSVLEVRFEESIAQEPAS